MAEILGEALLVLRTDDQGYDRSISVAETKARGLGAQLDRTSDSARDTGRAMGTMAHASDGAAAALGREAQAAQASVPALRNHATAVNASADAARRAAFQQKMLMFQLNDIGVSLASGMNPLMVMVQQGSQIQQIYAGEGGVTRALKETGNMVGGLVSRVPLLTAAIVAGGAAIAGMTYEINQASSETVSFGDVALATWQVIADGLMSVLKPVIDAVAPWFQAAWDMVVSGVKWAGNLIINSFRAAFEDIRFVWANFPDIIGAAVTGAVNLVIDGINMMVQAGTAGVNAMIRGLNTAIGAVGADKALELFGFSGQLGEIKAPAIGRMANPAAGRLANAAQGRNARVAEIMSSDPLGQFFDAVSERAVQNARKRKEEDEKKDKGSERAGRKPAEDRTDERYRADMNGLLLQTIAARRNLATTIEERYRLERQALDITAAQARQAVLDNDKYSEVQKGALLFRQAIKVSLERELLARKEAEEKARDDLRSAQAAIENERELLERSARLASTRRERHDVELRILAYRYEEERLALAQLIASRTADEREKARAAERLRRLDENERLDRQAVDRDYESPMERYRREVGDVGRNINDALEDVQVGGIQALEAGLTDVVTGARSLGEVFNNVADQIIAALARIAIQQLIIMPLLNALGGAGGGASGGLSSIGAFLGKSSAGMFAHGGTIPTGKFGIVGERGPEPVIATPRGALVRPNSTLSSGAFRPAGPSVSVPIQIDATGADPAALGRVQDSIDRLRADLPTTIVRTVQDAGDRRFISFGGAR